MKLSDIADQFQLERVGDADVEITGIASLEGASDQDLNKVLEHAMVVSCARGKSFNHRSIGEGTWIIVASGLLRVRMAMTETTRSRAESVGAEACVRLAMVHGMSGGQSDSTFSKARYDLVAETDTTCLLLTTHGCMA